MHIKVLRSSQHQSQIMASVAGVEARSAPAVPIAVPVSAAAAPVPVPVSILTAPAAIGVALSLPVASAAPISIPVPLSVPVPLPVPVPAAGSLPAVILFTATKLIQGLPTFGLPWLLSDTGVARCNKVGLDLKLLCCQFGQGTCALFSDKHWCKDAPGAGARSRFLAPPLLLPPPTRRRLPPVEVRCTLECVPPRAECAPGSPVNQKRLRRCRHVQAARCIAADRLCRESLHSLALGQYAQLSMQPTKQLANLQAYNPARGAHQAVKSAACTPWCVTCGIGRKLLHHPLFNQTLNMREAHQAVEAGECRGFARLAILRARPEFFLEAPKVVVPAQNSPANVVICCGVMCTQINQDSTRRHGERIREQHIQGIAAA